MRRTSTCAWRLRPRVSWPWVARRRLSCITTRCTAARSCSGPDGSARSSSLSGRDGGSACVRSICARSSSRRRCSSKRRIWSRVSGSGRGSAESSRTGPPGSERSPSERRIRCTSTPSTPEPWPRRPNAAIASRARSRIAASFSSRIARSTCSRRSSKSIRSPPAMPSGSSSPSAPARSRTPWRSASPSAARKKKRSNTRSKTRRSSGDLAIVAASASRNGAGSVQPTSPSAAKASLSSEVPTATPSARSSSAKRRTWAGKVMPPA